MQNQESANHNHKAMGFSLTQKLTVIAPVHNEQGEQTIKIEVLLQLLNDSKVDFELLLLDIAANQPASEYLRKLGNSSAQVRNLYCPSLAIQDAISLAIKGSQGDMIIVLDEGSHAVPQLNQLLIEQFSNDAHMPMVANAIEQSVNKFGEIQSNSRDESNETLIEKALKNEMPEIGGIDRRVLERLEQWAVALQNESNVRAQDHTTLQQNEATEMPSLEIPQTRPHEKDSRSRGDEIRRVDSDRGAQPKRKLPKFVTRFHEFI